MKEYVLIRLSGVKLLTLFILIKIKIVNFKNKKKHSTYIIQSINKYSKGKCKEFMKPITY